MGSTVAELLLAEGWAEPLPLDAPSLPVHFGEDDPYDPQRLYTDPLLPQNTISEGQEPYFDHATAADFPRRKRSEHKRKLITR